TVASTRSRNAKIAALAALLGQCEPEEIAIVVGFLIGVPRQGRVGVGWATMSSVRETARGSGAPLTVAEVDHAITVVQNTTGKGSVGARRDALAELFGRASAAEADFVVALFTDGLRQGALAGLMYDAIASAADVPAQLVRRAAMLSGDLGETARRAL